MEELVIFRFVVELTIIGYRGSAEDLLINKALAIGMGQSEESVIFRFVT
jgi:hypothetical protein